MIEVDGALEPGGVEIQLALTVQAGERRLLAEAGVPEIPDVLEPGALEVGVLAEHAEPEIRSGRDDGAAEVRPALEHGERERRLAARDLHVLEVGPAEKDGVAGGQLQKPGSRQRRGLVDLTLPRLADIEVPEDDAADHELSHVQIGDLHRSDDTLPELDPVRKGRRRHPGQVHLVDVAVSQLLRVVSRSHGQKAGEHILVLHPLEVSRLTFRGHVEGDVLVPGLDPLRHHLDPLDQLRHKRIPPRQGRRDAQRLDRVEDVPVGVLPPEFVSGREIPELLQHKRLADDLSVAQVHHQLVVVRRLLVQEPGEDEVPGRLVEIRCATQGARIRDVLGVGFGLDPDRTLRPWRHQGRRGDRDSRRILRVHAGHPGEGRERDHEEQQVAVELHEGPELTRRTTAAARSAVQPRPGRPKC